MNYPSSDCECRSHPSSPSASRIPESPLNNVEGLDLSDRSPGKGALVYSERKKLGKAKHDVDVRSEPALLQDQGGLSLEDGLHQDHAQGADGVAPALPCSIDLKKLGEESTWVLDRIIFFCKKIGLSIH